MWVQDRDPVEDCQSDYEPVIAARRVFSACAVLPPDSLQDQPGCSGTSLALEAGAAGSNYRRNSVNNVALIGPSILIKGTVTAREALTIAGQVEGSIDLAGFPLVVSAGAQITADIIAQTIVVGGDIKGSICAEGHIVVQKTATIEGELSGPSITIEDGAYVQGRFDISGRTRAELKLAS